jgi:hypothetical protein
LHSWPLIANSGIVWAAVTSRWKTPDLVTSSFRKPQSLSPAFLWLISEISVTKKALDEVSHSGRALGARLGWGGVVVGDD